MSRKRWVCTKCDRPGILAPGRMRTNDVRRYCMPCSEETGWLVERTCPALERKRAAKAAQRREKDRQKREKAKAEAAHLTAARKVLKRAVRLKAFNDEGVKLRESWLEIRDGSVGRGRAGRTGWAVAGRDSTDEWNALVIIHELAHVCCYRNGLGRGHGQNFRDVYLAALVEFFGLDRDEVRERWREFTSRKHRRIKAYELDAAAYATLTGLDRRPRYADILRPRRD